MITYIDFFSRAKNQIREESTLDYENAYFLSNFVNKCEPKKLSNSFTFYFVNELLLITIIKNAIES